jgi:hypothetical protein
MVTQTRRYRVSVLTVLHSTYVRQRANFLPSALVTLQREQIQVGKRRGAQRYYRSPNKKGGGTICLRHSVLIQALLVSNRCIRRHSH